MKQMHSLSLSSELISLLHSRRGTSSLSNLVEGLLRSAIGLPEYTAKRPGRRPSLGAPRRRGRRPSLADRALLLQGTRATWADVDAAFGVVRPCHDRALLGRVSRAMRAAGWTLVQDGAEECTWVRQVSAR